MAAPYDGAMAGATQYGMFQAQANQALKDATAQIHTQRSGYLRDQGFQGAYDANGNLTGVSVAGGDDARNGAYQQLHRDIAYQAEDQQAGQAALGFGGGLARQGGEAAQRAYEDATSQQSAGVLQGVTDFGQQEQGLTKQYNDQMYSAFMDTVRQDQADGKFNPANYAGLEVPGYGNPYAPGSPTTPTGTTPTPGPWQPPKPAPRPGQKQQGKKTSTYGTWGRNGQWIPWVPKKGR